jgi:hypothetical protein
MFYIQQNNKLINNQTIHFLPLFPPTFLAGFALLTTLAGFAPFAAFTAFTAFLTAGLFYFFPG